MDLQKVKIGILGAGRSGTAAAKLCHHFGARDITLYDSIDLGGMLLEGVKLKGRMSEREARREKCDLLVVSPGIDTNGDFVRAFAEGTGEIVGEMELASWFYKGTIIAITGTNGKTTTTELVDTVIRSGGMDCLPCGNYGVPLSEVVIMNDVPSSVALEVSSFQLETIKSFKPSIAVWLNFSADHMDRYKSLDDYFKAKLRIFENMDNEGISIVRKNGEVDSGKTKKISFSATSTEADYYYEGGYLFSDKEVLMNYRETSLRGTHNAENVLATLAVADALKIDRTSATDAIKNYKPLPHRCELVEIIRGVEYLNDSKATNLHALESALNALDRPVVLIAGGKDKGLDYTNLTHTLSKKVKSALVYGEIGSQLEDVFGTVINTIRVANIKEAVLESSRIAKEGWTVLLSPGTSSFDQFSGYQERGDYFKACVRELKTSQSGSKNNE